MEAFINVCKPLCFCLKWVPLNIDFDLEMGPFSKLLIFILSIPLFSQFLITLYGIYFILTSKGFGIDLQLVYYSDGILSLIIFLGFIIRRKRIIGELLKMFNLITALNSYEITRSITFVGRCSTLLTILGLVIYLMQAVVNISSFFLATPDYVNEFLADYGFKIYDPFYAKVFYHIIDVQFYQFVQMMADFHALLLIFIFCVLQHCFKVFNAGIQKREYLSCLYLHRVQHIHQELGDIVKEINVLFSPIILIYITLRGLKIVLFINLKNEQITHTGTDLDTMHLFQYYTLVLKEVVLLLAVNLSAAMIFNKSQETVGVLLGIYLRNPVIQPQEDGGQCRNYHVTTLFVAQELISPVGITGSNLFVINYGFISVVISTIVTYLSLLSSLGQQLAASGGTMQGQGGLNISMTTANYITEIN